MQQLGMSADLATQVEARPCSGLLHDLLWRPPVEALATAAVCSGVNDRPAQSLAKSLRQQWPKLHTVICHDEQPSCDPEPASVFKVTRCRELQVCLCGEDSPLKHLPWFKQRLQQCLAKTFPGTKKQPSAALSLLRRGLVVLKLYKAESPHRDALDAFLDDEEAASRKADELYVHVGYCNFLTFACCVLPLTVVEDPNPDGFL